MGFSHICLDLVNNINVFGNVTELVLKLCNQVAAKITGAIWPGYLAEFLCCQTELVIT